MKLLVYPNRSVAVDMSEREATVIDSILYFFDPNAETNYDYRNGEWDGMRSLALDKDRSTFLTGHLGYVLARLRANHISPQISLQPTANPAVTQVAATSVHGVTLRDYQVEAANVALAQRRGVIKLPPRSGKSLIAVAVAKAIDGPSVLLVDRRGLLEQHEQTFRDAGIDVGVLGGKQKTLGHVTIATFQSILSGKEKPHIREWLDSLALVQIDETHHIGSGETYASVVASIPNATYRIGYSATPYRGIVAPGEQAQDRPWVFEDFYLTGLTGPLLYERTSAEMRELGTLANAHVVIVPIPGTVKYGEWYAMYARGIVHNKLRNRAVVNSIKMLREQGHAVLVLVKEIGHGSRILTECADLDVNACFIKGGGQIDYLRTRGSISSNTYTLPDLREQIEDGTWNVVIATSVADEGVDLPGISAVVMAAGGKSTIKTIQRAFRPLTATVNKISAVIVDFLDKGNNILLSQSKGRIAAYTSEGLPVELLSDPTMVHALLSAQPDQAAENV